ncbi:MAG TPA: hypothetical protein VIY73_01280 [Polyangiaceae bacterium]
MKATQGEHGADARAHVLSSELEKAVDRVLVLEMEYARAVRRIVARGGTQPASLTVVDAAREMASRLLVAWSRNPALEQHAVVAQDALADVMEKTIALACKEEDATRAKLASFVRDKEK